MRYDAGWGVSVTGDEAAVARRFAREDEERRRLLDEQIRQGGRGTAAEGGAQDALGAR